MKALAVLVVFCWPLIGQEEVVNLNGTDLKLGMPKSEALDALGIKNTIRRESGENWCVKLKTDQTPDQCLSHVSFREDKLYIVYKTHATAWGDDAGNVVNAFFNEMKDLQAKGRESVDFDTTEMNMDSVRVRAVRVWVGNKEFDLTVTQSVGAPGSEVSFTETLYARKNK